MNDALRNEVRGREGDELHVPCPSCIRRTAHEVAKSVELTGDEGSISWGDWYQVIRCRGCGTLSFRRASTTTEDFYQVGEDQWEQAIDEQLYPPRASGRKDIGDQARLLPPSVRSVYEETVQALNSGMPLLASIGLRSLIEAVCREYKIAGNLEKKIDALVEQQVTTPKSAEILHQIRELGNSATHEATAPDGRKLLMAMDIIEHMLRDVYIHPRLAEAVFGDKRTRI